MRTMVVALAMMIGVAVLRPGTAHGFEPAAAPGWAPESASWAGHDTASDAPEQRFPFLALRPGADWLSLAPGRTAGFPGPAPSGTLWGGVGLEPGGNLLLDLHPLSDGFRFSFSPAADSARRAGPVPLGPDVPGRLDLALGGDPLAPDWYLGFGWTGTVSNRINLFVDVGAVYHPADSEARDGLAFSLTPDAGDDDSRWTMRLAPVLSITFSYQF